MSLGKEYAVSLSAELKLAMTNYSKAAGEFYIMSMCVSQSNCHLNSNMVLL